MRSVSAISAMTLLISTAFVQSYVLKPITLNGGGLARMTSSSYIMGTSIAQSFAAKLASGGYIAYIGYWTPGIIPTGIEESDNPYYLEQPTVFSLNQNYPNPVTSRTAIRYDLPKACMVTLKLFDVAGRQVAVLVDETQNPGCYKVTWNVSNVSQKRLANGVYFYRIEAGDFLKIRKLIVCR